MSDDNVGTDTSASEGTPDPTLQILRDNLGHDLLGYLPDASIMEIDEVDHCPTFHPIGFKIGTFRPGAKARHVSLWGYEAWAYFKSNSKSKAAPAMVIFPWSPFDENLPSLFDSKDIVVTAKYLFMRAAETGRHEFGHHIKYNKTLEKELLALCKKLLNEKSSSKQSPAAGTHTEMRSNVPTPEANENEINDTDDHEMVDVLYDSVPRTGQPNSSHDEAHDKDLRSATRAERRVRQATFSEANMGEKEQETDDSTVGNNSSGPNTTQHSVKHPPRRIVFAGREGIDYVHDHPPEEIKRLNEERANIMEVLEERREKLEHYEECVSKAEDILLQLSSEGANTTQLGAAKGRVEVRRATKVASEDAIARFEEQLHDVDVKLRFSRR